jgi:nicotinate-nucleotide adenylyltransferase
MSTEQRIGVFGGTFDPVHNTHIDVARTALEHADLDKVLFMVAARPPHKRTETHATPEQRLQMVKRAVSGESQMDVSDIELHREGPSYTADTLRQLAFQYPDARFKLIIGKDSLIELPNWRDPETILELADLLVVPRPGDGRVIPEILKGHYEVLPFEETDVSSTEVRRRIGANEPVADLIPQEVEDYIRAEGMYDGNVSGQA